MVRERALVWAGRWVQWDASSDGLSRGKATANSRAPKKACEWAPKWALSKDSLSRETAKEHSRATLMAQKMERKKEADLLARMWVCLTASMKEDELALVLVVQLRGKARAMQ